MQYHTKSIYVCSQKTNRTDASSEVCNIVNILLPGHIIHHSPVVLKMPPKQLSRRSATAAVPTKSHLTENPTIEDDKVTIVTEKEEDGGQEKEICVGQGAVKPRLSGFQKPAMDVVRAAGRDAFGARLPVEARRVEFKEKIMAAYTRAAVGKRVVAIPGTMCSRSTTPGKPKAVMADAEVSDFYSRVYAAGV